MSTVLEPVEFIYELHLMPPGRFPFTRWRWELWHRERMLAAGWRRHPLQAQRAVRSYAMRHVHRIHGLHPLRPDATTAPERRWGDHPVLVRSGELQALLTPRALAAAGVQLQPVTI